MTEPKPTITCPRCQRVRPARNTSSAVWKLTCETCRLLASVEKHRRQIAALYRRIEERRMRGL